MMSAELAGQRRAERKRERPMSISRQALERMKEVIGGDKAVLAEILQSFIDEAEPLAESILSAARDGRLPAGAPPR